MILVFLCKTELVICILCRERKLVVREEEEKVKIDNFVLAHHLQGSVSLRSLLSLPHITTLPLPLSSRNLRPLTQKFTNITHIGCPFRPSVCSSGISNSQSPSRSFF